MTKQEILSLIDAKITENNAGNITATELNRVLTEMLNETPLIVTTAGVDLAEGASYGTFAPNEIPDNIRPLYDNYQRIVDNKPIVQDGNGWRYFVTPSRLKVNGASRDVYMLAQYIRLNIEEITDDTYIEGGEIRDFLGVIMYLDESGYFHLYMAVM
jgi:hypothetical protein